jgi:hypothetical protein
MTFWDGFLPMFGVVLGALAALAVAAAACAALYGLYLIGEEGYIRLSLWWQRRTRARDISRRIR